MYNNPQIYHIFSETEFFIALNMNKYYQQLPASQMW